MAALTAAAYLPWLLVGLPAGAWVDRLPRRPLMVVCDVVSTLSYASLPAAAWLHILTIGQVLGVQLLAGAAAVFFATGYQVYLPSLVAAADLVEGNAKLQGSAKAAQICGRGAAGLAAQAVGGATALLFNSASFLVSAACLLSIRIRTPPRPPADRSTSMRAEIAAGIGFIARDRYLRPLTVYSAVANLAYTGSTALVVVFLVRVAGFGSAAVGLLMASSGAGGIAGAMVARRFARWRGTARALLLSTVGTGVFGLLIPLTATGPRAAFYIAGAAVVGAGLTSGNIIITSFRQTYTPPDMLGRVTASQRFLAFGTIPLGALLAGGLGTALGVRSTLWIMLASYALSGTLLLTRTFRMDKNLPRQTAATAGASRSPGR